MSWDIIPEFFYDLIGRLLPGAILLVLAVFVFYGIEPGLKHLLGGAKDATVLIVILMLLLGYFVSRLMEAFSEYWRMLCNHLRCQNRLSCQKNGAQDLPQPDTAQPQNAPLTETEQKTRIHACIQQRYRLERPTEGLVGYIIVSKIRRYLPAEGFRLLKMQAEQSFCQAIIPGLLLLTPVAVWRLYQACWLSESVRIFAQGCWRKDKIWLVIGLLWAIAALRKWKTALDTQYWQDLYALWYHLETDRPPSPTPQGGTAAAPSAPSPH